MISFNKERKYIVTGASSGIGETAAILLNKLGATVIAIARNKERLGALKEKCKNPENMHIEVKSLTDDIEGLSSFVKDLKEKYGKFSGLAYCAGVTGLCPARTLTYEYSRNIFDINYFAPIMLTKGLVDKRNNIGKNVSLVYVSSIDAKVCSKGQSVYSGTKAALCASILSISKEYAVGGGIRMNCILPSAIDTPMTKKIIEDGYNLQGEEGAYPFGFGKPIDAANLIVYLLSDKSKTISGQNFILDSGGVM